MIKLTDILEESVNRPIYSIIQFLGKSGINEVSDNHVTRLEALIEKYGEETVLEKFKSKAQLRYLYSKHPKIATSWMAKHKKGEVERLPNRKHPRKPGTRTHKVATKHQNNKSVRGALKSLGNR
jgi:hypothetical protein|tara:strand:+ start:736 stop:1107 length:372 start_codon:yes stop_codon:yes gene_type:complete